jgi:23S rRNA pseudouridine1911/1915/1917 synthase
VRPKTGRTHQIRVHLAAIGFPIVGDAVYGAKSEFLSRQFLHASKLVFKLPSSGEQREFVSELPPDLTETLRLIAQDAGK